VVAGLFSNCSSPGITLISASLGISNNQCLTELLISFFEPLHSLPRIGLQQRLTLVLSFLCFVAMLGKLLI
jgi:hypothetical protein